MSAMASQMFPFDDVIMDPKKQGSHGPHGANLDPVVPRWAPCWPHEPCYQGKEPSRCQATANSAPNMVIYLLHVMNCLTHMLSTIVLSWGIRSLWKNIWNIDARERQNWLAWAKLYYVKWFWNKWSDPFVSNVLLLRNWVTIIFTVKLTMNN